VVIREIGLANSAISSLSPCIFRQFLCGFGGWLGWFRGKSGEGSAAAIIANQVSSCEFTVISERQMLQMLEILQLLQL